MGDVWVTEQGARLSLDHRRLIIAKEGAVLVEAPLGQVERVMLLGNVHITTPAMKRLLTLGIPLVLMGLDGRYYGRLVGQMAPHIALRRQQYLWQGHSAFALAMAQRIVAGKIRNQRTLLQRQSGQGHEGLEEALEDLEYFEARARRTQTLHALRGVEGSATARYFAAYRLLFREPWHFERRTRRPPADAINVLLSLGYTFLARLAESAVEGVGLDPYAGFLHQDEYNRPSLALDLCEEFRCVIEGLVLHVCHHGVIRVEDFRPGEEGERPLVMEREAIKRYVQAYTERFKRPLRHPRTQEQMPLWRFVHLQAQEVARCLREGQPDYRALVFR